MAKRSPNDDNPERETNEVLLVFGQNVREARKRVGLTQKRLGEIVGLTQQYIFFIENHGANTTAKSMLAIANACKVSLLTLMPDTEFSAYTSVNLVDLMRDLFEALSHCKNLENAEVSIMNYPNLFNQLRKFSSPRKE